MCYKKSGIYKDTEKYNECSLLFEKMIMERTKMDKNKLQIQTIIINDKTYCKVNGNLFYCNCFQTIGLSNIKEIEYPCTIVCFSCTNQARKYAEQNNITIISSMIIHLFGMNPFLPKIYICNKREQNEYILRYGDLKFAPKIIYQDPYIQYIGAKKGNLLRIHRKQDDSTYIYYRFVI